jgi:phage FluMu protein gp41
MSAGESKLQICRSPEMPTRETINNWLRRFPSFLSEYNDARQLLYQHWADETLEISDDGKNDWMEREVAGGRVVETVNGEVVQRSRLRVDTRKWLLSKMLPRVYGDRTAVQLTGANDGPITHRNVDSLTDEELEAIARGSRAAPTESTEESD